MSKTRKENNKKVSGRCRNNKKREQPRQRKRQNRRFQTLFYISGKRYKETEADCPKLKMIEKMKSRSNIAI